MAGKAPSRVTAPGFGGRASARRVTCDSTLQRREHAGSARDDARLADLGDQLL